MRGWWIIVVVVVVIIIASLWIFNQPTDSDLTQLNKIPTRSSKSCKYFLSFFFCIENVFFMIETENKKKTLAIWFQKAELMNLSRMPLNQFYGH